MPRSSFPGLILPGLYFVGLPFQTSFASATLRGVGSDAELVVARACRQVASGVMNPTGHPDTASPGRKFRTEGPDERLAVFLSVKDRVLE